MEFLTHKTTCVSEMLEKTTCEKILSKTTPYEWQHPWPGDTWHVPPGPVPAGPCRRCQTRHVAVGRRRSRPFGQGGPCRLHGSRHAELAAAAAAAETASYAFQMIALIFR
jgi:hypothetical protein